MVEGPHVYVGGSFASMNSGVVLTKNLARVDATTGGADGLWVPNPDGTVNGLVSDGTFIYASGPLGGGLLGWGLDSLLGTKPWLTLVMLFLGFGVGIRNVVRISRITPSQGPGKKS